VNSDVGQGAATSNKVVKAGTCVTIAAALLVASFFIGVSAVLPVVGFYFIALLVAAAQILDSRLEKRSRGQPPKRPAQRGQALEVSAMAGSAMI